MVHMRINTTPFFQALREIYVVSADGTLCPFLSYGSLKLSAKLFSICVYVWIRDVRTYLWTYLEGNSFRGGWIYVFSYVWLELVGFPDSIDLILTYVLAYDKLIVNLGISGVTQDVKNSINSSFRYAP